MHRCAKFTPGQLASVKDAAARTGETPVEKVTYLRSRKERGRTAHKELLKKYKQVRENG